MRASVSLAFMTLVTVLAQTVPPPDTSRTGKSEASPLNPSKLSWRVGAQDESYLLKVSKSEWTRLIYQLVQEGNDELAKDYYESFGVDRLVVGDYVLKDLDGDGRYELVASIGVVGRPFFNTVSVVGKIGNRLLWDRVESWGERHDFSKEIVNLRGDKTFQLLAKKRWVYPLPEPVLPQAFDKHGVWKLADYAWVDIYSWQDGRLVNASSKFPHYYNESYIPQIQETIGVIDSLHASSKETQGLLSYYQTLLFKARRVSGDKTAGLNEAIAWVESGSEVLQQNAILVLRDIADPRSVAQLKRLAGSGNTFIAREASNALRGPGQK